jgi:hypothetical protein
MKKITILMVVVFTAMFSVNAQTWQIGSPNVADVTATLSNGTLTISGTGNMQNWDYYSAPWSNQRTVITTLIVQEGVSSIGDYAFYKTVPFYKNLIILQSKILKKC